VHNLRDWHRLSLQRIEEPQIFSTADERGLRNQPRMNANKYTETYGASWLDAGSESFFRGVDSNAIELFSLSFIRVYS
jgi:hypothetical protein